MKYPALLTLLLPLLLLTGCGEQPTDVVEEYLQNGDINDAIAYVDEEIEDDPTNALFNGLAAELRLRKCFKDHCFNDEAALRRITGHMVFLGDGKVKESDEEDAPVRDVFANLFKIIRTNLSEGAELADVARLVKILPASPSRQNVENLLLRFSIQYLEQGRPDDAVGVFNTLAQNFDDKSLNKPVMLFLVGLLKTDNELLLEQSEIMKDPEIRKASLSPVLMRALPLSFYYYEVKLDEKAGAQLFVDGFSNYLDHLNFEFLKTPLALETMASTLFGMAENEDFRMRAAGHMPPLGAVADVSNSMVSETVVSDASATQKAKKDMLSAADIFRLKLLKVALVLSPKNEAYWQAFLPLAVPYIRGTGDMTVLTEIDNEEIPEAAIDTYNRQLIELTSFQIESGQNVLPLLERIIVPADGGAGAKRDRDRLLKVAIDKAAELKRQEWALGYANFDPDIARQSRQQIVTLLVAAIEDEWKKDNFDNILALAEFIVKRMGVEFNLDGLLLQSFDTYLKEEEIPTKLVANDMDILLKPQEEIALDLGPKFSFIKKYFATNPAVLDAQLKNLVIKADGLYGVPTAMYRLTHLFDDEQFPAAEREKFLVSTLVSSIRKDNKTLGPAMANIGYRLHKTHPGLPLVFIINNALERTASLKEGRQIWHEAADDFKVRLRSVKPQFTALMEGADAFDDEQYQLAAERFVTLSNINYLKQAEEFFDHYRGNLLDIMGTYTAERWDDEMKTVLMSVKPQTSGSDFADILRSKPATDASDTTGSTLSMESLLGVEVSFINAVGTVKTKSDIRLTEDYGRTFKATVPMVLNADEQAVDLSEDVIDQLDFSRNFARTFGDLTKVTFTDDGLVARVGSDYTYDFIRTTHRSEAPLFPFGRYGIVSQVSKSNSSTDHVLPIGSILEMSTDVKAPTQPVRGDKKYGVVFPVSGQLMHPASDEPITLSGFYSLNRHTLNMTYSYPYGRGGAPLDAVVRCHVLETQLVCAGHNKHWRRQRHSHIVKGRRAAGGPEAPQSVAPVVYDEKFEQIVPEILPPPDIIFEEEE